MSFLRFLEFGIWIKIENFTVYMISIELFINVIDLVIVKIIFVKVIYSVGKEVVY